MLEILFLVLWLVYRGKAKSVNTPELDRTRIQKKANIYRTIFLIIFAIDIILTLYFLIQSGSSGSDY
ncbi:MAG TPA: hypothetical protein VLI05_04825 [Candidatus Saccharimonadia bacterium]|nr:hypothetical protein [Candidatus Saccharimonadia bacterium]